MRKRKCVFNLIFAFFASLGAAFFAAGGFSLAHAEEAELGPIAYLDYALKNPKAIYADGEIVAVSQESGTVFFYDGKIYEKDISAEQQIARSGDHIYYTHHSVLRRVKIGVFAEEDVKNSGDIIPANGFAVFGSKLITLTNSGALLYENMFTSAPSPYSFNEEIETNRFLSGNAYSAEGKDYFALIRRLYINGDFVYENPEDFTLADYMTEFGGKLYFSNRNGIFRFDGEPVCVYEKKVTVSTRSDGVLGLCARGDKLLFIDGETDKIMQMDADGSNLKEFHFDVKVNTAASVPSPAKDIPFETVTVRNGSRIHFGGISGGVFNFTETAVTSKDEDYIKIGEESGYSVLFGNSGYAFIRNEIVEEKPQNTPITFEKGLVLHACKTYDVCLAITGRENFGLKKGDGVTVVKIYEMNGINYALVETESGELTFVPAGEITESFLPPLPVNTMRSSLVTGKDDTAKAVVIIILSTAVLLLALFVIFVKKEYVKL
ncbi:MAG: hypothetical protein IJU84_08840 [Clostridia bacterium]|nr:hypothetical protein [Clostridia bacterium]